MILETGRPKSGAGREEKELRVYDLLDELEIEYERVDHESAMTMEICEKIDAVLGARICKNLFLCNRQQTDFYLLMIPGDKPFKTKDISAQIGASRLSFASPENMENYLGTAPGSASVFGLMNDKAGKVRLLIDEEVLALEYFGAHPCANTSSLKIRTDDLINKIRKSPHYEHVKPVINQLEEVEKQIAGVLREARAGEKNAETQTNTDKQGPAQAKETGGYKNC